MKHDPQAIDPWADGQRALPVCPDSETLALLRGFLTPLLEAAGSWTELSEQLQIKGYGLSFRQGHMVITNLATGQAICTGAMLGVPLREIAGRIGRPAVRANCDGQSGELCQG